MTAEEIEANGIAHRKTIDILEKAKKGKTVSFKEFLMLYIDDMEDDATLIDWCKTDRERALAYAVIALNSRIMNDADPMKAYDAFIEDGPVSEEHFDKIKIRLGFSGYEPMSEEDEKELAESEAQFLEFMKAKELAAGK